MSLDDLKQRIREEIPISNVIGHYLSVKKSGSSLVAVCPFHSDTKPSMHINDSKKIYKCFACEAAGDVFSFVMKHRHLDFIEAMKEICQKEGINFDSYQEERKSNPKMELAKKILNKTALLYRKLASTHSFKPYDEFIQKRGLDEEIATTYSLGFAPAKNSLLDYLNSIPNEKEKAEAIALASELTLIKPDKNNPKAHYDTFRDRIIFPIWDQLGQVIGFTSRSIRDNQIPKYLNSSDSFVFNKSQLLYGFHLAKNAIREKDAVILVEGNMDQVALFKNGFQNSVAIMGVALGESSLERLLSLTKNIYLALDSDNAGLKAMERINRQFNEKGITPKFIEFLPQKDADEFLIANGKLALQEKIDTAGTAIDYLLSKLIPDPLPEVIDRKLEILNKAFELLSPLGNHLLATERVVTVAKRLGLKSEPSQIVKNYQDYLEKNKSREKTLVKSQTKIVPVEAESDKSLNNLLTNEKKFEEKIQEHVKKVLTKSEKQLVQELVQLPALLSEEKSVELLDFVSSDEVKNYIGKMRKIVLEIDESEYVSVISNFISQNDFSVELKEAVSSALFKYKVKEVDSKTKNRILHDLKLKIQIDALKVKKDEIKARQKMCSSDEEMNALLKDLTNVEKELQLIKKTK